MQIYYYLGHLESTNIFLSFSDCLISKFPFSMWEFLPYNFSVIPISWEFPYLISLSQAN